MDPLTMTIAALAAGVAAGISGSASSAVQDAYAELKSLVLRRLAGRPGADVVLAGHERDPGVWRARLLAELAASDVGSDQALTDAARALLDLCGTEGEYGKYSVYAAGAQGVQVGDGNRQDNTFGPREALAGTREGRLSGADPDKPAHRYGEQPGVDAVPTPAAPGASVVQAGSFNTQINYYYAEQTWARQSARPLLAGSPYRGLSAFEAGDAELFFGRDEAIRHVLERMSRRLSEPGMVVVSGVSGAGKSSLLRAGVLPGLRRDGLAGAAGSASWPCLLFAPGRAPLDELAVQVASLAGVDAGMVQQSLAAYPAGFALTARQAALVQQAGQAGCRAGPLLLIIDQFEQLFTACPDEGQRQAFIAALHAATSTQGPDEAPAALVVLGVRADFEARCADYPELAAGIQDRYLLTSMTDRQLRLAITGPAARADSSVDPDLTEVLLREISSRQPAPGPAGPAASAGVLPLLSHALDQAWRNRAGKTLTLADYERTGGIEAAVARSAQEAYDELIPAQQAIARQVFIRLTAVSPDGADTAVPAVTATLSSSMPGVQTADTVTVLKAFADRRLLTLADGTVEITHEALLTAWPLLHDIWLAETRADRIIRTGLSVAAARWEHHSRDPAYLYTGSLLETATTAAARADADPEHYPPLAPDEQVFLAASGRERRHRARRRQRLLAALTALVVALAASTGVALAQRNTADSERNQAASDAMGAQSQTTGDSDPALARLEAVAAWHLDPTSDAGYALLKAAVLPGTAVLQSTDETSVYSVAFSPDGKTLAVGTYSGATQLWGVAMRRLAATLSDGKDGTAESVAFSPDGKLLAVATNSGTTQLWDVATRRLAATLPDRSHGAAETVAFSPDGKLLAVGANSSTTRLWDVATRRLAATLPVGNDGTAESVAFSPDGKLLAIGTSDGSIKLVRVATRRITATLLDQRSPGINSVAFSPDGKTLAAATQAGTTQFIQTATGRVGATLQSDGGVATSVAFSPDGKTLAIGDGHGKTRLVNVATRRVTAVIPDSDGNLAVSVAFSPDGKTLAVGTIGGKTQLSDVATETALSNPVAVLPADPGNEPINSVVFSPDGKTLAVGTYNGTQLLDIATRRLMATLQSGNRNLNLPNSDAFSPDGTILAAGTDDGIQLWDMATRKLTATLPADNPVYSVAFSPDGKLVAAAGPDSGVALWDVATHRLIGTLRSRSGQTVAAVAFSPDGGTLAVGTYYDGTQVWNVRTHRLSATLPVGAVFQVVSVGFSPDGKTLAVSTSGGTTQLWDIASSYHLTGSIYSGQSALAATDPRGTVLAIGTGPEIQLWDMTTRQQVEVLPADGQSGLPPAGIEQIAFSPDGTFLATTTGNGKIALWSVPYLAGTASYLCVIAGQPFPPSEWAQYAPGVPYQKTCP